MRLGIREGKDCNGESFPEPYNVDTGEAVEGVIAIETRHALEDVATCTITCYIYREGGRLHATYSAWTGKREDYRPRPGDRITIQCGHDTIDATIGDVKVEHIDKETRWFTVEMA